MPDKVLVWVGASFEDLRDFPPEARRVAGIHTGVEHRVMYMAKFEEAVYVLHAFEKKSRQTREKDLALARERLQQVEILRHEERRRR